MGAIPAIEQFRYVLQPWNYAGVRLSVLSFRDGDVPKNLLARAVFDAQDPGPGWPSNFTLGPLNVEKVWVSGRSAERLLEHLAVGDIPIRNGSVSLARAGGGTYGWTFLRHHRNVRLLVGWPGHELVGSGDDAQVVCGGRTYLDLEDQLLVLSRGRFGTFEQLFRFMGRPDRSLRGGERQALFEVVAPIHARIARAHLTQPKGDLLVQVETGSRGLDSRFAVYAVHVDQVSPIQFQARDFTVTGEGRYELRATLPLADGPYDLHLLVGDVKAESKRVGLPRPSQQAHEVVDPGGQWLQSLLQGPRKQRAADAFEHYVVTLLNLIGLPAVHYGFKNPDNAPDIVAELDEETILVGECKVTAPTSQSLETLHARTIHIVQSVWGPKAITAHALCFHAASPDRVPPEARRYASEHNLQIVSLDRLSEVHALWERGEPQEVLLRILLEQRSPLP